MNTEPQRVSVSPAEAAKMYGLSRNFFYNLIRDRHVESIKAGSAVRIDLDSLRDWYESNKRSA